MRGQEGSSGSSRAGRALCLFKLFIGVHLDYHIILLHLLHGHDSLFFPAFLPIWMCVMMQEGVDWIGVDWMDTLDDLDGLRVVRYSTMGKDNVQ